MTTMDAAAARRRHPRVALAVLMALAGLGLAGCETSNSLFGSTARSPRRSRSPPSRRRRSRRSPRWRWRRSSARPMRSPSRSSRNSRAPSRSSASASSTSKDERADYTLRGYIVAAKDKNATKVSYIWDVTDPTGKRVNRITGEEVVSGNASKDPWAALTPAVAQIDRRQGCRLLRRLAAEPDAARRPSPPTRRRAAVGVGAQPRAAAGRTARASSRPSTAAGDRQRPPAPAGPTTGSIAPRRRRSRPSCRPSPARPATAARR